MGVGDGQRDTVLFIGNPCRKVDRSGDSRADRVRIDFSRLRAGLAELKLDVMVSLAPLWLHDAGHASRVHEQRAFTLELPAAFAPRTQVPMHVPGHHRQYSPPGFASVLDRLRQIRIAPIARLRMEVASPR